MGEERPEDEGRLLVRRIADRLPQTIDAREAIESMRSGGSRHWRQMEWIGFYPEFLFETVIAPDIGAAPGPRYGNMNFDIRRKYVWDLKSHATGVSSWAPLNDVEAVTQCLLDHGGLGFIVLSGSCLYDDDGSFKRWHEQLKGGPSEYSKRIASRGASSRRRKVSYSPDRLVVFRFNSADELARARREGWIKGFQEGMRNSNDRSRRAKIMVDLGAIGQWAIVEDVRRP